MHAASLCISSAEDERCGGLADTPAAGPHGFRPLAQKGGYLLQEDGGVGRLHGRQVGQLPPDVRVALALQAAV